MAYISGEKLKGDIYKYRRLKAKNITIKRNFQTEKIIQRAENILQQYNENKINIHVSDQKIMAQYIDTFGFASRNGLLNKLQKESAFNVRQYLSDSKLKWWQKAFNIKPKQTGYLSAGQLQKRINSYKKLGKILSRGFYHSESQYHKQIRMEEEAVAYAARFLKGEIKVTRDDASVLQKYWQIVGNVSTEIATQKALQQLQEMPAESFAKPVKTNRLTAWFKNIKQRFTPSSAKKISLSLVPTFHRSFGIKAKVAGLATLMTVVGLFGLKSDKSASGTIINKTEQKAQPKKTDTDAKTIVLQPVEQKLTAEQKIWQNFYNTKNTMLADMLKLDAAALNNTVKAQARKGIFNIAENGSSEQLVYTHLIYKAYGLHSPLEDALNATHKISAAQQESLDQAVKTAGQNGLGVKKIALQQARKHGKKLSRRSAFDNASEALQTTYLANLRQVRELNQR